MTLTIRLMHLQMILIIITFVMVINHSEANENFFIAKQYERSMCITKSSNALSWVQDEIKGNLSQVSIIRPEPNILIHYHDYNMSNSSWTLTNSIEGPIHEAIFDRRWEALHEYNTIPVTGSAALLFERVFVNENLKLPKDFTIPMSVRITQDAHILLCNRSYPTNNAGCYWIMLEGWNGKTTALRKCTKSPVPTINTIYPKPPCNTLLIEKKHNDQNGSFPRFLSNSSWNHFYLERNGGTLSFSKITNGGLQQIFNYTDSEQHNMEYLIFNSRNSGLWKPHYYKYWYVNKSTKNEIIGVIEDARVVETICIALFAIMCDDCSLEVTIAEEYNISNKITQSVHQSPQWKEHKLIFTNGRFTNRILVKLSVISKDKGPNDFWAIDGLRLCNQNEFRYIQTKNTYKCQLVNPEPNIIDVPETSANYNDNYNYNNCPPDTIGSYCIACSSIFANCERIQFCEKSNESASTECSCSAGYSPESISCNRPCDSGFYGFGCKNKCGNCETNDECTRSDGKCSGRCKDRYSGPKCDIAPGITFKNPPIVTEMFFTGFRVKVADFDFNSHGNNGDEPKTYTLQYRASKTVAQKAASNDNEWKSVEPTNVKYHKEQIFELKSLKSDTSYDIRAIITTKHNKCVNSSDVPFTTNRTSCREIAENEIIIKPSNTSVEVYLQQKNPDKTECTLDKYPIDLAENQHKKGYKYYINATFDQLTPFTNYTIHFGSKLQKTIRTLEGVLGPVENLKAGNRSATSVSLTWKSPDVFKRGPIRRYTIEIEHKQYLACTSRNYRSPENTQIQVTENAANVSSLLPNSQYKFTVYAENSLKGTPAFTTEETRESDFVSEREKPIPKTITAGNDSVNMRFNPLDCTKIQGNLTLQINVSCADLSEEWCRNVTDRFEFKATSTEFGINSLFPYTNYDLNVLICRKSSCLSVLSSNYRFKTDISVPNEIRDVIIYSKDEHSISIRWKAPYPPTGILAEYNIVCSKYSGYQDKWEINITNSPCKIWPDYQCAKCEKLTYPHNRYVVKIRAKNQQTDYGPITTQNTTTEKSQSNPPKNLRIQWFLNNDLGITWEHPNITNGDLQKFQITLRPPKEVKPAEMFVENVTVSEETYNLTYFHKILNKNILPSTRYKIRVAADNGYSMRSLDISIIESSPPEIPSFEETPEFSSTNKSIAVKVVPKIAQNVNSSYLTLLTTNEFGSKPIVECNLLKGKNSEFFITLGELNHSSNCQQIWNITLTPGTEYNLTVLLNNTFQNKSRSTMYNKVYFTGGEALEVHLESGNGGLYALLLLLAVLPLAIFLYVKRHRVLLRCRSWKLATINYDMPLVFNARNENHEMTTPLATPMFQINTNKRREDQSIGDKKDERFSKRVGIMDFEQYVKDSLVNEELELQHGMFPRGQTHPWKIGSSMANKSKNRYANLVAYDHSRVILREINGDLNTTYINANYIDGYKIPKAFIATQGPKATTLNDFWRMVWEKNVRTIVMVANVVENGKKKVEKYWPDANEEELTLFNGIDVKFMGNDIFADYEHRIFDVVFDGETRRVAHLHFNSWPDHGVPLYSQSLVPFLKEMLKVPSSTKSPVVVHCSAGDGRTGTVVLCDIALRMAAAESAVDLLQILTNLRNQRPNMVDNIHQYKLAHLVVLECLLGVDTSLSFGRLKEFVENVLDDDLIRSQMRHLKDTAWQDQAMKKLDFLDEDEQEQQLFRLYESKNRRQDVVPEYQGRVNITRYPPTDESSSYINAVKVDAFRSPGMFIVTQNPMPNTLSDFWRMIDEHNVPLIISLNDINLKKPNSCDFWPVKSRPVMRPVDYITLQHLTTEITEMFNHTSVILRNSDNDEKTVGILSLKGWKSNCALPPDPEQFLIFWKKFDFLSRGLNTSTVVTCFDGATASGLFVAMAYLIETMKLEKVCDVCRSVRTVRQNREHFIQEEAQFHFLYDISVSSIDDLFGDYANFKALKNFL